MQMSSTRRRVEGELHKHKLNDANDNIMKNFKFCIILKIQSILGNTIFNLQDADCRIMKFFETFRDPRWAFDRILVITKTFEARSSGQY